MKLYLIAKAWRGLVEKPEIYSSREVANRQFHKLKKKLSEEDGDIQLFETDTNIREAVKIA